MIINKKLDYTEAAILWRFAMGQVDREAMLMKIMSAAISAQIGRDWLSTFPTEVREGVFRKNHPEYQFVFDLLQAVDQNTQTISDWMQTNLYQQWHIVHWQVVGIKDQREAAMFKTFWM